MLRSASRNWTRGPSKGISQCDCRQDWHGILEADGKPVTQRLFSTILSQPVSTYFRVVGEKSVARLPLWPRESDVPRGCTTALCYDYIKYVWPIRLVVNWSWYFMAEASRQIKIVIKSIVKRRWQSYSRQRCYTVFMTNLPFMDSVPVK